MKCSRCNKKAKVHLPDNEETRFCEDHAIEYLKTGREMVLPWIKEKTKKRPR